MKPTTSDPQVYSDRMFKGMELIKQVYVGQFGREIVDFYQQSEIAEGNHHRFLRDWYSPISPILMHFDEYQAEIVDLFQDFLKRFSAQSKKVMDKVSSEPLCILPVECLMSEIGAEYCRILLLLDALHKSKAHGEKLLVEPHLHLHSRIFEEIHKKNPAGWYLAERVLSNQSILSELFLNTWFARAVLMHFYEDNPSYKVLSQHKAALNYIVRDGNGKVDCDKTNLITLGVDTSASSTVGGGRLNRFAKYFKSASEECTQWKSRATS